MTVNLGDPQWDGGGSDAPPFVGRFARIGRQAGAHSLGATLYELPAGAAIAPLHFHHGNEELLVVVAGAPVLRTFDGERPLATGEVVAFPMGPDGAHRVDNPGPGEARILVVSTMFAPDVIEYPDSEKVMARTAAPGTQLGPHDLRLIVRRDDAVGYYDGER
jgi:uncharacterized cupin superfamily protein